MTVVELMRWSLMVFVLGLAGTVAVLLLIGRINVLGLLRDKNTGGFSPARLQSLTVTLAGAATYLGMALGSKSGLPDPPPELLAALGGSHAVYLGAKVTSALRANFFKNT
jgi:hypothetical protein